MEIAASLIEMAHASVLLSPVVLILAAGLALSVATGLAGRIALLVEDVIQRRGRPSPDPIPVSETQAGPARNRPDRP